MRATRDFKRLVRMVLVGPAVLALAVLTLAGCGAADGGSTQNTGAAGSANITSEPTDKFPITIEHAFGEATIDKAPTRVATWGWGSTEAAIAVGVYPVAVGEQVWTVGEKTLLPWVEEAYQKAGIDEPRILSDPNGGAEVPYDEFIAAKPDLIVAPYSGLTQEQYQTLTKIAPVVAFPEAAWTTTWDDNITITAQALGRSAGGDEVLADIDSYLADAAAEHPEFKGKTLAGVWVNPNNLSVYTEADPRVAILTKLGFEVDPSVATLDTSKGGFFFDTSYEKVDQIAADVVVSYYDTEKDADAAEKNAKVLAIPAFRAGAVAEVVGRANVSAVSPPTALSFNWSGGMPQLVDELADALDN